MPVPGVFTRRPGDHAMDNPQETRSENDTTLTELGRGKAERAVLGSNPMGTMARIIVAVVVFIVLFGTVFYFAQG